jgi:SAM-dependent methyltransferase
VPGKLSRWNRGSPGLGVGIPVDASGLVVIVRCTKLIPSRNRMEDVMGSTPIANVEQAEAWNSDEGRHWVSHQDRYDAMAGAFNEPLLGAAAIAETDLVLDVGCGNGQTTRLAAARANRGRVLGVDISAPMLERARATAAAEEIGNVEFEQGDAQVHPLPAVSFDVAISRYGVMFFADSVAAFANIGRAIRSGGRLAFTCWQDVAHNEWVTVPATAALQHVPVPDLGEPGAPGPFSLAEPAQLREVLGTAGFEDVEVKALEAPMRLGDDAADAVEFLRGTGLARAVLGEADPDAAGRALEAMGEALRPYEQPGGVYLNGVAWLVTARRP